MVVIFGFMFIDFSNLYYKIFPKPGFIFVESPEVYSRERLINERLAEDTWLKGQLKEAGRQTTFPITARQSEQTTADISQSGASQSESPQSPSKATDANKPGNDRPEAPSPASRSDTTDQPQILFSSMFRIRSAARSLVRQRMIENKLDDRHDIAGNTLFILKFDTTVLSAPINKRKALVEIRFDPPEAIGKSSKPDDALAHMSPETRSWMVQAHKGWLGRFASAIKQRALAEVDPQSRQNPLDAAKTYIESAIKRLYGNNINYKWEDRDTLNISSEESEKSLKLSKTETASSTLHITGVDNYAKLLLKANLTNGEFSFDASPNTRTLYLHDANCVNVEDGYFYYSYGPIDGLSLISVPAKKNVAEDTENVNDFAIYNYWTQYLYDKFLKNKKMMSYSDAFGTISEYTNWIKQSDNAIRIDGISFDKNKCEHFYAVTIEQGLIEFAKKMIDFRSYSYSVLPKESAVVYLNEIQRTHAWQFSQPDTLSAKLKAENAASSTEMRPTVVTFGETSSDAKNSESTPSGKPIVGWIIDPGASFPSATRSGELIAVHESTIAIVSVPAWWSSMQVTIERSWIDSSGKRINADAETAKGLTNSIQSQYIVDLPPNFQVLDGILFKGFPRKPIIDSIDIGSSRPFDWNTSCTNDKQRANVLITGRNLWRNTVVTLGSHEADEIRLLPDMNGVLAIFKCPLSITKDTKVRVWTSTDVAVERIGDKIEQVDGEQSDASSGSR